MDRNMGLAMALGLLIGGVQFGHAEGAAMGGGVTTTPPASHRMEHKSMAQKENMAKIAGTVESIDVAANRIEVKAADGTLHQFNLTSHTKVMKAGKTETTAKVMKGDKVNLLRYNKATRNVGRLEIGS